MNNEYYYNGKKIVDIIKKTNKNTKYIKLEDGSEYKLNDIKIQTKCIECGKLSTPTTFYFEKDRKKYICPVCRGINHNPFKGKRHSQKVKNIISKKAKERDYTGQRNPMYGKNIKDYMTPEAYELWKESIRNSMIGEKNPMYGQHIKDHMTQEKWDSWVEKQRVWGLKNREAISQQMKDVDKKWKEKDYEGYIKAKKRAGRISHIGQTNYKMNSIEKKVEEWLKNNNVDYDYSCIMGFGDGCYQYDFIIHNKRMLIEVNGDYWHGNKKYFNLDGSENKRKLNDIQLDKIKKDAEKKKFAEKHNFKLIYIWENEIKNNDYSSLEGVLND